MYDIARRNVYCVHEEWRLFVENVYNVPMLKCVIFSKNLISFSLNILWLAYLPKRIIFKLCITDI